MTTGTQYRTAATQLLEQARQELARGDARQASEKAWGAAAQAVKAVAERRGWYHKSHAALFDAVNRLTEETGNNDFDGLFHYASSLHVNFYENWMNANMVRIGIEKVAQFIALMAEAN